MEMNSDSPNPEPEGRWKEEGAENQSDWKWQFRNRITSVGKLPRSSQSHIIDEDTISRVTDVFPMAVTPYYASLIDWSDEHDPIRMQCIPDERELLYGRGEMEDPLREEAYSPMPAIVHRYPDRVLFLVTLECSTYCRHCTRKRKVGDKSAAITAEDIRNGIEYIRQHEEVRDVLISGGDPFTLNDETLDWILGSVRAIPHVEVIRIGTRTPVVMPQRITESLVGILKKYHPLWINTHFNHPKEITTESEKALARLADAGIPLGNQTVLLKGVNDSPEILKELFHLLVKNRVRPYYLYHCDYSRGIQHFRTSVRRGIEILEKLIGYTSGFAIPLYVIDVAGGGGKIPLLPNYCIAESENGMILRNFEGNIYHVEEDQEYRELVPAGAAVER